MEGRLLRPLGLAYVASLGGSLIVALTVTPVLYLLLLPRGRVLERSEPWLLRRLKRAYDWTIAFCLARPGVVLVSAGIAFLVALAIWPFLGRSFLPPFNEGSLTLAMVSPAGTPLEDGDALGEQVERALLPFPRWSPSPTASTT